MSRINYDIFCLDRVLSVEVQEQDKKRAAELIDLSYFEWCVSETCDCCEEFILKDLETHGIKYRLIEAD